MIRFINLGHQLDIDDELSPSFAFFDTVCDKFCEFSGEQVWRTVEDFLEGYDSDDVDRYLRLIPFWSERGARA